VTAGIRINGAALVADLSGALVWPERSLVAVADLHLEKASGFARTGQFLPPYDTAATLAALAAVIERHRPRHVVCLGDSFHDGDAAARLSAADGARLRALVDGRTWTWIVGNHDPSPPGDWGGRSAPELTLGPLTFRHEALADGPGAGEVSGHFHPKASVRLRGWRISGRCFVDDGRRLVLPAFGAFTGGLDARDPAIRALFPRGFQAHILGRQRIHRFLGRALG
jgi:DNA ligase-associated metallophosphoesterase